MTTPFHPPVSRGGALIENYSCNEHRGGSKLQSVLCSGLRASTACCSLTPSLSLLTSRARQPTTSTRRLGEQRSSALLKHIHPPPRRLERTPLLTTMRADHTIASLPGRFGYREAATFEALSHHHLRIHLFAGQQTGGGRGGATRRDGNKAGELQPRASSGARPRPTWLWQVAGRVGWASARGCGSLVPERRRERDGRERAREASFEMRSSESTREEICRQIPFSSE